MLALAFSAMTFTSCEDVPAPYAYPEAEGDGVFLNTTFANSLSPWTSYVTEGEDGLHWKNAYSSAVCTGSWDPAASAASNSPAKARVNHAGKAWLVSPTLDLSGVEEAFVSFDHAIAYERTAEIFNHHVLMYSTEYQQGNEPGTATWRRVDFDYGTGDHSGNNFNFEQTGANLTPEMLVDGITFAFVYESTTQNASTWEVKNFLCMKGQYQSQGGGGGEGEVFKQATGVTSGQTYAFVASSDNKFYAATALTGTYGYLPQAEVQIVDGEMNAKDEMKFTFTKVDGGYTIQDADGQYLYMTGTYNSFNRSADVPAEGGHIWSVSFNENGTVNVVNVAKSKTIQYSAQHTSWGSYEAVSNILPMLFTNGDTGGESGEGGGGGGGGGGDQPTGHGYSADDPLTVAEALQIIDGLADKGYSEYEMFVKGVTTSEFTFSSQWSNCNYYIGDEVGANSQLYVYAGNDVDNKAFTAAPDYPVGSTVVIKGKLQKYVDNSSKVTPEIAKGNYLVSIDTSTGGESGGGGGGGGGDTQTCTKTVDEANLTVTFTNNQTSTANFEADLTGCGIAHQTANPVYEVNGITFTFSKGDGSTDPKYWCTGAYDEFRMYAKNQLVIDTSAHSHTGIAKVVLHCTELTNSGTTTKYLGNDQCYATVDGNVMTIVNDFTQASAGTQLRIKKVDIYWY